MKANNHRQGIIAAATWECRSNTVRLWLAFLLLLSAMCAKAQEIPVRHRFSPGEEVQYELYFKWGLLMPRAGHATLSIRDAEYEGEPSCHYRLIFRTSGIIEKVYKMRDTIDCHFTPDMLLLRSEKRVNENDYYLIDDIRFSYDRKKILAHSHRFTHEDRHDARDGRPLYVRHAGGNDVSAFPGLEQDEERRELSLPGGDRARTHQHQFPLYRAADRGTERDVEVQNPPFLYRHLRRRLYPKQGSRRDLDRRRREPYPDQDTRQAEDRCGRSLL